MSQAEEALVCLKISEILSAATLVKGINLNKERTEEVIKDLSTIALKFSGSNITAAVSCLAHLTAQITHSPIALLNLAEKCFISILEIAKITSNDNIDLSSPLLARTVRTVVTISQAARIQRCLVVLGSISEHSRKCNEVFESATLFEKNDIMKKEKISGKNNFKNIEVNVKNEGKGTKGNIIRNNSDVSTYLGTDEETATMDITDITRLTAMNMNGCTYAACMYALTIELAPVQARAVQSLCGVFIGCPRLMLLLQDNRLMDRLLSDEFPDSVREKFLTSLRDMMMAEEVECSVLHY